MSNPALYPDMGLATLALEAAERRGELRRFRVKFEPARCACCGRTLRKGMPVVSPERGRLIGRCCWWH